MLHPPVRLHGTFHVTRLYAYVRVPATVAQIRNAQRAEKHAHRTTSTAILALFDRFVLNVVLGCVFVRVNFPSLRFAHARGSPTARQWQAVGGALLRRRSAGSAAQPRCRRYRDLFDRFVLNVVLGRVLVRQRVDDVEALGERVVDLDERLPLLRQRVLRKDRLDRALRFARAAVDALLGVDDEDAVRLVDAVDGADVDARAVFDVDAGLRDDVRHKRPYSTEAVSSRMSSLARSSSADFTTT